MSSFVVNKKEVSLEDFDMVLVGIGREFEDNTDALPAYNKLSKLLENANYFAVSLCMDDAVLKSELKADRVVCPLGTHLKKQCINACCNDIFEASVDVCPKCGEATVENNIWAENYVEAGYLPMWEKYRKWLTGTINKRLLLLELGANLEFAQIVRFPFERMAMLNNKSQFIRINEKFWQIPEELKDKAVSVQTSAVAWLNDGTCKE